MYALVYTDHHQLGPNLANVLAFPGDQEFMSCLTGNQNWECLQLQFLLQGNVTVNVLAVIVHFLDHETE